MRLLDLLVPACLLGLLGVAALLVWNDSRRQARDEGQSDVPDLEPGIEVTSGHANGGDVGVDIATRTTPDRR